MLLHCTTTYELMSHVIVRQEQSSHKPHGQEEPHHCLKRNYYMYVTKHEVKAKIST